MTIAGRLGYIAVVRIPTDDDVIVSVQVRVRRAFSGKRLSLALSSTNVLKCPATFRGNHLLLGASVNRLKTISLEINR